MRSGEFSFDEYEEGVGGLHCYLTELNDDKQSTYAGIMRSKMRKQWKSAMEGEMKAVDQHHTWYLVDLPAGNKVTGSGWLFKVKRNDDSSVNNFKARLVAQVFAQKFGVNLNQTFVPVIKHLTVRTVLTIAAGKNLEAEKVDVDIAFLCAPV